MADWNVLTVIKHISGQGYGSPIIKTMLLKVFLNILQ